MTSMWHEIEQHISAHCGSTYAIQSRNQVGGGSINNAFRISDGHDSYFVKTNRHTLEHMFAAETLALEKLYQTATIKVPQPIAHGVSGHECYMIMTWLDMSGQPNGTLFGEKLARLHQVQQPRYGFDIDNTIGSTPQLNQWSDDWVDFWRKQRLGYQLNLILDNGLGRRVYEAGQELLERCGDFFSDYQPLPSLLHGDLWSGNWSGDQAGFPVIFDPASYYGDRESDLAMMELFGRPPQGFLAAYESVFPLDPGFRSRKELYNLYHILNHANLFGSGYTAQAEHMIESLLAELR